MIKNLIRLLRVNRWTVLAVFVIICTSVIWRVSGLRANAPLWVDEFASISQAKLIQASANDAFQKKVIGLESNNFVTHALISTSLAIFGESKNAARIPALVFGSLVPIVAFFVGKKIGGTTVGFVAGFLLATSYLQITWSLQARGYMIQQFWILATLLWYANYLESAHTSLRQKVIFFLLCIGGIFTHYLHVLFLLALAMGDFTAKRKNINIFGKRSRYAFVLLSAFTLIFWLNGGVNTVAVFMQSKTISPVNNIWYYHSFLWREYGLVTFLAIMGFATVIVKRRTPTMSVILLHLLLVLSFNSFVFRPYASKYLLPLFPYLFLSIGILFTEWGRMLFADRRTLAQLTSIALVMFIVINGNKFVTKPKQYYSVNHDFREIANIDYDVIYDIIKKNIRDSGQERVAIVETWMPRTEWYLGKEYEPVYYLGSDGNVAYVNGISTNTIVRILPDGSKTIGEGYGYLNSVADLKKIMGKEKKGFMFIDSDLLAPDVQRYAENNLKKEIFLDHYPLDDNPYSLWPATLYSWGLDK